MKNKFIACFIAVIMLSTFLFEGCRIHSEETIPDSYWYGCASFSVASVDGYIQNTCASFYYENFYYLAVYGQKIDETIEGPDDYYYLFKIDECGNKICTITLPSECASTKDQIIVDDKLYCIEPTTNVEYVVDINTGSIVSQDYTTDSVLGYYSINNGFVKITENNAFYYSLQGEKIGEISLDAINNLYAYKPFYEMNDRFYIIEDNVNSLCFYELDFNNGSVNKVFEDNSILNYAVISGDITFTDSGVYYLDLESETLVPITEWSYVDVRPAYKALVNEINLTYGNKRFGKLYTYSDYEIELIIFNNISSDKYANRESITIGGYGVESSLAIKWAVYNFNTTQEEYRIYLDDYWYKYPYTSGVEAQVQIAQLIQYFNEGNAPDIYYGTNFDYRYMYNSGLVANILPIIESDSEFDIDDMLPSIKNTIISDGVCYQIFPAYTFNGDFGLRSVFGDEEITYLMIDELSQETGLSIRGDMQSAEFADQIIRYSLGELVDCSDGSHIVSLEELRSVVNYSISNGIPCNAHENYIADMDTVHDGTFLTCRRFLRNLYDLSYIETNLNDSFVYLGFPSINGSAHAAEPDGLVAISEASENKEACWQFIKYMLSEEVQEIEIGQGYNPVISNVFDDYCNYALFPESVPNTEIIWNSIVAGKEAVPEWIVSDYQIMVNSIDTVISYDWGLYNLICEEINSYDLQGKSVDAIAESLQARLDLYVSENYG